MRAGSVRIFHLRRETGFRQRILELVLELICIRLLSRWFLALELILGYFKSAWL